jgi:hypothetical protein
MRLVYIDDAKEGGMAYFAAIMISADRWRDAVADWKVMLNDLAERRGFRTSRELHATKLLGGHGNYFAVRPTLTECVDTHVEILQTIAQLPSVGLFLSCGPLTLERRVFERLITRVDRTMETKNAHALVICDNGKTYDDLLDQLRRRNIIWSRYGAFDRPLTRLVEDIVYRDSKRSTLIQAADACVYTLFRKQQPLPRLETAGFARAFDVLAPAVVRAAAPADRDGIIRC